MKRVIVIGGGASGLIAAYAAAKNGNQVELIEKNEKLGKKIYITGKGRCNLTNNVSPADFLTNVVHNAKFLTSSVHAFPPASIMQLMEENGTKLKIERGNRVFPVSDHASDITKALGNACKKEGVQFHLEENVLNINCLQSNMFDIITNKKTYSCDCVIVCTGGLSYPSTGSDGDGYRFAKNSGHNIIACSPALTGINLEGGDFSALQGLSLKNVSLTAKRNGKNIYDGFGEMLFTHYGISGPLVLTLSSEITRINLSEISIFLDLKPALSHEKLGERILRDFKENQNKSISNAMISLLPAKMIGAVLDKAHIPAAKKVNIITKEERAALINTLKSFPMRPISLRGFDEAIITSGGINVKEINPKTMESKLVEGLYFCGEVLDVDAYTGGFNMQIAFSTGYAAGNSIR